MQSTFLLMITLPKNVGQSGCGRLIFLNCKFSEEKHTGQTGRGCLKVSNCEMQESRFLRLSKPFQTTAFPL